ncbi:MAG TPA: protein kinase [Terrimicrobiaceae bacterium]|nr:protein kinase [Terrimicrobiaceae bacterium]
MNLDEECRCPVCGTPLPETREFCPVCILRAALTEENKGESPGEKVATNPPGTEHRFQHYELAKGEDGLPIELGRGAMGVTYKGFDVDLHRPVTLKVINEKYIGDESARSRFMREARMAASLRHPHVASVFHLGKTGNSFFYAMEFVEGQTLESLIKHSGPLEPRRALEITYQVAAGLSAIHKQKLVHRDIKPSNIMVSFGEGDSVAVKIIDLGLAKAIQEEASEPSISVAGAFVGTPEFASPEQAAGVDVDIRSDLYSLGVTLWEMLTGQGLFRGPPANVIHQHQHAPLPRERLEGIPQPIVLLLEMLLEKDPARRFQTPAELLDVIPSIIDSMEAGRTMTHHSLGKASGPNADLFMRRRHGRHAPEKVSIARLPVTGSDMFGRDEDLDFLDKAWVDRDVNVASIVAWAGVGKSTLINHWLRRMAAEHYRSAELVFGWSFYRQGSGGEISSGDEFINTALDWFGDPDPRIGTAWQKGERLADLIAHRRTLLILDGLEPLQFPPGSQEGRIRDPSLQSLLRELAALNSGLCMITTRLPIADIADHERTSAPRRDLEHLSSDAGAKLLQTLGVRGDDDELRNASKEFDGHCLALTLLGSYLTDAYRGDVRRRTELSEHLTHDVRQGAHARKVMESYQIWFDEGPELSVLRMLGLFDRPADAKVIDVLLEPPAIAGLTESLLDVSQTEWRAILARLRRARLLAGEDPDNPGQIDAHPLIREHFGEQLLTQRLEAWKEGNRRLHYYYRTHAPQLPESFRAMEPLFQAVVRGCNAGLFREALHEIYIPRIQRGSACYAAHVLGARGALLATLARFFDRGRWGAFATTNVEGQGLTAEDQLFVLLESALNLSVTRGTQASEVRACYDRAERLSRSLNRPLLRGLALIGKWRYSLVTDELSATLGIAKQLQAVAQEQNDASLSMKACMALAATLYYLGKFESAHDYAAKGVAIWRSGEGKSQFEEIDAPEIAMLCHKALCEWHFGETIASHATIAEAISVAKEFQDRHGLAVALFHAAVLAYREHNLNEVESLASELVELSTRQNFAHFVAVGTVLLGWARSAGGNTSQGISWIQDGMERLRTSGSLLGMLSMFALKAEALHLGGRTSEALQTLDEADALVEAAGGSWWCAELSRLRAIFLIELGAEEARIEEGFAKALKIASQQKSVALAARAETSYAKYQQEKILVGGPAKNRHT